RRVAPSICRAWARPTTPARYPAIAVACSRLSWAISILRSCGINSRTVMLLSNSRAAIIRSPRLGESARPGDDAFGVIARHLRILRARRCGENALLDVDETEIVRVRLAVGDTDEHRIAQTAERAAAFIRYAASNTSILSCSRRPLSAVINSRAPSL